MKEVILLKSGEIALKGLNRGSFEDLMIKNCKRALKDVGEFRFSKAQSTTYVEPRGDADMADALDQLSRVFGVAALCRACVVEKSYPAIEQAAAAYLAGGRPLKMTLLLMDIRRDPEAAEHGLLEWLAELGHPAWLVATKADKLGRGETRTRLERIRRLLAAELLARPPLAFSALTGQGRAELIAGLAESGLMEKP